MHNVSAFVSFVPPKSKVLKFASEISDPDISSSSDRKIITDRIANLFCNLKRKHRPQFIAESSQICKDTSSLSTTISDRLSKGSSTRCRTGEKGIFDPRLLGKLDIEANFDIKALLRGREASSSIDSVTDLEYNLSHEEESTPLAQQKLREWFSSQSSWIYPKKPMSDIAMKLNESGSGGNGSQLATCDYWQKPSSEDISNISVIKRRRLNWQKAVCSALDELLMGSRATNTSCNKNEALQKCSASKVMESFYVLGVNAENTSSSNDVKKIDVGNSSFYTQQAAKGIGMSGYFFLDKGEQKAYRDQSEARSTSTRKETQKVADEQIMQKDKFSCILHGIKKPIIDRLIDLGASPMEMINEQEYEVRCRNKSNRHMSSIGRSEESAAGKTVYLTGSYALRVAVDCLIEMTFSTLKSAKFALDVPRIVSRWPFTHGVQTPLHSSFIQCNYDFYEARSGMRSLSKGNNDNEYGTSGSSAFDREILVKNRRVLVPKPYHRLFLTGMMYTSILPSLSQALCALAETHRRRMNVSSSGSCMNPTIGNYDENDQCGILTGNSNSDDKINTYQCDNTVLKDPLLGRLDETFMHFKSLHNRASNFLKEEENMPSGGTIIPLQGIEVSVPKVPFILTTIQIDPLDNMADGGEGQVKQNPMKSMIELSKRNESIEGNDADANFYSNSLNEDQKDDGKVDSHEIKEKYNDHSSSLWRSGWLDRQRAGDNLYFVIRTTSLSGCEKFSYYSSDILSLHDSHAGIDANLYGDVANNLLNSVNTVPVDGENGITEMNSFKPFDEIRWKESEKSDISVNSFPKKSDNYLDLDDENPVSTIMGKKRKYPMKSMSIAGGEDSEKDLTERATDEIIFGEKPRRMYLVKAQHSSALRINNLLQDPEVSGAVLKPMNEYEIYAPETLEDRERKRMS